MKDVIIDERPLLSVIIPVYNVEEFVEECITSVIKQKYENLEILIIDDGSTDMSGDICKQFQQIDNRIRVIHTKNGGLSKARNMGLDIITGKYCAFVDSDDYLEEDMYQKLIFAMKDHQADIGECNFFRSHEKKQIKKKRTKLCENSIQVLEGKEIILSHLYPDAAYPNVSVCNKVYKTEIINLLRFPEGKIHEDYMFQCQALLNCRKYCYLKENLYFYRVRKGSITQRNFSKQDIDKIEIYKERTNFFQNANEWELSELAKANEFIILFSYFWKAQDFEWSEKKMFFDELKANKKTVFRSELSIKRKIIYGLFYINPKFYCIVRNILEQK